jgi:hypothetical protein
MSTGPSRRIIISSAAAAVGSTLLPARAALAAKPVRDELARSRFRAELSKSFTLASPTGSWPATLTSVDDLPFTEPGDERRFSLTFEWGTQSREDGTLRVSRPGFTPVELFFVAGTAGRRATAVVNRR